MLRAAGLALLLSLALAAPSAHAAARPGDVISSTPAQANLLPGVALRARAWHVLYRSTTAAGDPTVVSATLLVPRQRWTGRGPRPLLGYAVGSQGLASRCAPSRQLADGSEYEAPFIEQALEKGWALAVTDYPGLGTPGRHPYVVGRALGPAVLDAMRAALRDRDLGLDPDAPLAIYGYSEGGAAAGWALQLAPTYAPDLKLLGGAVGAAPANFNAEYHYLEGGRLEFLIMYTALGMDAAYPDLHLDRYLNATGRSFAAEMRDSCLIQAIAEGQLRPTDISAYVSSNPIGRPDWQAAFAANDLGTIAPQAPVLLGAGRHDEVMDYATAGPGLYRQWCARGADVVFDDIPLGAEHVIDAPPFASTAFAFLDDRLRSRAMPRGCG